MTPPLWQPNVVHNSFAAVLRVVGSAVDPVMVMVCVCVVSVVSTTLCQRINNLILAQQLPSSWWPTAQAHNATGRRTRSLHLDAEEELHVRKNEHALAGRCQ